MNQVKCIGLPLICISQAEGLGPPQVISWLLIGLHRMCHAVLYGY